MPRPPSMPANAGTNAATATSRRLPLGPAVLIASLVLTIYVVRLIGTVPASAVELIVTLPDEVRFLTGTLWQGTGVLDHGYTVEWDVPNGAVREALTGGVVPLALRLRGGEPGATGTTDLETIARLGYQSIALTDLRGTLDHSALLVAGPTLKAKCAGSVTFEVARIGRAPGRVDAAGRVASAPARCTLANDVTFEVPALELALTSDGTLARGVLREVLRETGDAFAELASVSVAAGLSGEDDTLTVRIEPAGASLVPGMPSSRATILEMGIGSGLDLDL